MLFSFNTAGTLTNQRPGLEWSTLLQNIAFSQTPSLCGRNVFIWRNSVQNQAHCENVPVGSATATNLNLPACVSSESLSMGLKAWMTEGRLGSQRVCVCGGRTPAPSGWSLPLLWNWKLHKWVQCQSSISSVHLSHAAQRLVRKGSSVQQRTSDEGSLSLLWFFLSYFNSTVSDECIYMHFIFFCGFAHYYYFESLILYLHPCFGLLSMKMPSASHYTGFFISWLANLTSLEQMHKNFPRMRGRLVLHILAANWIWWLSLHMSCTCGQHCKQTLHDVERYLSLHSHKSIYSTRKTPLYMVLYLKISFIRARKFFFFFFYT